MKEIRIGKHALSTSGPPYFIADIGSNHDGSLDRALKLVELAKGSGADAAKFQNFKADQLVSKVGFDSFGRVSNQASWGKSVYQTYKEASVPLSWTEVLKKRCDELGIEYFTSSYDFESVEAVDPFVSVYKIGSGDITWLDIIEHIARKRKPVIIATGASSMEDVDRAMEVLARHTNDIILMQCNTNYTSSRTNFQYINLRVLKSFQQRYPDVILGLSDHTPGFSAVLGAVALGAVVFEKHFTDDYNRDGQDHKFAMNPSGWKEMVERANELYLALGDGVKRVESNERETAQSYKRAIRARFNLGAGSVLSHDSLDFLRPIPENGLPPYRSSEVIGKTVVTEVKKGELILLNNLK